jgi:hypothetical protein
LGNSSEANLAEFILVLNSILKPEILGPELAIVQLLRTEWSGKLESLDQYFRKLEDEKYRITTMAEVIDADVFEKLLVALSLIEIRKEPKFKAMISHILAPSQESRQSSVPENLSDLKTLVATYQVNNNFVNGREQFAVHDSPRDGKTPGRGHGTQAATTAMASTTNTGEQNFDCPCGAKRGSSHDKFKDGNPPSERGGKQGTGSGVNNKKPPHSQRSGAGKSVKLEGNSSA